MVNPFIMWLCFVKCSWVIWAFFSTCRLSSIGIVFGDPTGMASLASIFSSLLPNSSSFPFIPLLSTLPFLPRLHFLQQSFPSELVSFLWSLTAPCQMPLRRQRQGPLRCGCQNLLLAKLLTLDSSSLDWAKGQNALTYQAVVRMGEWRQKIALSHVGQCEGLFVNRQKERALIIAAFPPAFNSLLWAFRLRRRIVWIHSFFF